MNAKRLSLVLVVVLVALLAVQMRTYAQGGPSFTVSFNPEGSTQVGQSVKIHVKVNDSTYGASKITVSCGGVSKVETSEIEYDSTWSTNGCSSGGQSVLVCTKTAPDEQWQQANCQQFGYGLTGSNPNIPSAQFWADTGNLQPGQCSTMHWQTSGATSVNIDGKNKSLNGDEQICPSVTTKYSLSATGPGGTAYLNFSVTVTTAPQPQSQGPTNSTSNDQRNVPSQPGRPTLAQARQQGTPGGIDVVVYCAAKGYGGPSNAPDNSANAAYSWKCGNVSLGDFNQVCRDVYGDSFHSSNVMGANRLGGWRCVQGGNANPAPAKPQVPTNCSGVLPPHLVIGQKAIVTQEGDGHNLRAGNGLNEPIRGNLKVGDAVVVIGGPRCTDGYQWWQLQTSSQGTWWAAEADALKYWLEQGIQPANQAPVVPVQPSTDNRSCGNAPATRLSQGMRARVARSVNGQGRVRTGPSQDYQITKVVPVGTEFSVTGQPKCAGNSLWYPIQVDNGTSGWMMEGWTENFGPDYYLEPVAKSANNQSSQPAQPAAIPPNSVPSNSGSKSQNADQPSTGCLEVYVDPMKHGIVPEALAAEPSCYNYVVDNGYKQVWECIKPGISAYMWIDAARKAKDRCGLTINPSSPQAGDLVVWQNAQVGKTCEGANAEHGHIAVLVSYQNGSVTVNEAGWGGTGTHTHPFNPTCMSFIHANSIGTKPQGENSSPQKLYPPLDQEGSSWVKASSVHIGPYRTGETNDNWVEVAIPSPYKRDSFVLHLTYLLGDESLTITKSTIPTLCIKGYDYYRFILRSDALGQIESKTWINQQMLQDPSAWYVTFSKQ